MSHIEAGPPRERKLSPEERLLFHQEGSGPVMKRLKEWLTAQLEEHRTEPNSGLGKAITFLLRHWTKLTLFLRQPGTPLDNNIAERALKKAILHRKNALFYKTMNGAHVGRIRWSRNEVSWLSTATTAASGPGSGNAPDLQKTTAMVLSGLSRPSNNRRKNPRESSVPIHNRDEMRRKPLPDFTNSTLAQKSLTSTARPKRPATGNRQRCNPFLGRMALLIVLAVLDEFEPAGIR